MKEMQCGQMLHLLPVVSVMSLPHCDLQSVLDLTLTKLKLELLSVFRYSHCNSFTASSVLSSLTSPTVAVNSPLNRYFALLYVFANGRGLYNTGDAEHISKAPVCRAVRKIICDAAHIITNVEAKWPGSEQDSCIYRGSTLSNRLDCGEIEGFLLGDRSYPCQPTLITPYPDPQPGPQQHFNVAHCWTRARLEMTVGLLKACSQCLHHLSNS
uniref:putative nuclease HARBI1 n=1 Tax=Scatophagus argus TaxID=75038 RepID=UPI001ED851F1|nr:putative nuclease HARBI1 [Scatophagus argus]